jgi:hypothetical protein
MGPFVFVSPERGFLLDGGQDIQTTVDGGRTWRRVYHCRVTVEVAGVPRDQNCAPRALAFAPDRATGFVVTRARRRAAGGDQDDRRRRDVDGGFGHAGPIGTDASLAFADAFTGYPRRPRLKTTLDGGQTWHAVTARIPEGTSGFAPRIRRLDGQVTRLQLHARWRNAGSRADRFSGARGGFHRAVPDTGYVAAAREIYRYRIVPFDYAVPNMLAIPGMTTFALAEAQPRSSLTNRPDQPRAGGRLDAAPIGVSSYKSYLMKVKTERGSLWELAVLALLRRRHAPSRCSACFETVMRTKCWA